MFISLCVVVLIGYLMHSAEGGEDQLIPGLTFISLITKLCPVPHRKCPHNKLFIRGTHTHARTHTYTHTHTHTHIYINNNHTHTPRHTQSQHPPHRDTHTHTHTHTHNTYTNTHIPT